MRPFFAIAKRFLLCSALIQPVSGCVDGSLEDQSSELEIASQESPLVSWFSRKPKIKAVERLYCSNEFDIEAAMQNIDNVAAIRPGEAVDIDDDGTVSNPYRRANLSSRVYRKVRGLVTGVERRDELPNLQVAFHQALCRLSVLASEREPDLSLSGKLAMFTERVDRGLSGLDVLAQTYRDIGKTSAANTIKGIRDTAYGTVENILVPLTDAKFARHQDMYASVIGTPNGNSTADSSRFLAQRVRLFARLNPSFDERQVELLSHIAEQLESVADFMEPIPFALSVATPQANAAFLKLRLDELELLPPQLKAVGVLLPAGWTSTSEEGSHSAPIALRIIHDRVTAAERFTITVFNAGADTLGEVKLADDAEFDYILSKPEAAHLRGRILLGQPRTYLFYDDKDLWIRDAGRALEILRKSTSNLTWYKAGLFARAFNGGRRDSVLTPGHARGFRRLQVMGNCTMHNSLEFVLDSLLNANESTLASEFQKFGIPSNGLVFPKSDVESDDGYGFVERLSIDDLSME